jgi:hypothetical protein
VFGLYEAGFYEFRIAKDFSAYRRPNDNQIEVTFEKVYFNTVRDIEKQYISVIASKMTDLSKTKCFQAWPIPLSPDSMSTLWTPPPKAFKRTGTNQSANSHKKAGTTLEYSLTKNSKLSYKDASTL